MTPPRLWYGMFALLSVLIALVSTRAWFLPLTLVMPDMAHYAARLPLPLWGHLVFGPLALVLAPFQLATRLRSRRPGLHRATGWVYAASILLAALSSLSLLPQFAGTTGALTGFLVLAVLWIGFSVTGIIQAIRGQTARHRVWMLRSAALTFAAVTLRVMMAPLMAAGWTVLQTYDVTAWASWLINLAVVEVYLRRGAFRRMQPA